MTITKPSLGTLGLGVRKFWSHGSNFIIDLWENKPVQERQLQIREQDYIKINQEPRKKLKKKKKGGRAFKKKKF